MINHFLPKSKKEADQDDSAIADMFEEIEDGHEVKAKPVDPDATVVLTKEQLDVIAKHSKKKSSK